MQQHRPFCCSGAAAAAAAAADDYLKGSEAETVRLCMGARVSVCVGVRECVRVKQLKFLIEIEREQSVER